jgi:transcriptional regulator with PAS, ATPase and Fis domain
VALNVSAIPETLLDAELFGHVRGAFTGAVAMRQGRLEQADGGTLFLDEVGTMPMALQMKLLRVLQEREFERIGDTRTIKVDVRIVAATNAELLKMVKEGTFREDLYYRLNVVNVLLPPLRDRREDIPSLLEHLVRRHNRELKRAYKGVDNTTLKLLMSQPWKGNVRELDNVIEHAMILGNGEWITVADLPRALRNGDEVLPPVGDDLKEALRAYERIHIETVLRRADHDKRKAADMLGLSLSSLYRKLNELGIELA